MAKDEKPAEKPGDKAWTPDQPIPDKEVEESCQSEAARRARIKHLEESLSKPSEPESKKKSNWSPWNK